MTNLSDGLKDIFLAGVGAMAITGEKSKELIDQLIAKGEISVEQGREINQELQHKATETVTKIRYDALEQHMATMTDEERAEFAAHVAELAANSEKTKESAAEVVPDAPADQEAPSA
ncbi:MAG: hypothetical protein RR955_00525 [Raoultibacter sp.]